MGCNASKEIPMGAQPSARFFPTKDETALINGTPLTLDSVIQIKNQLGLSSLEKAYDVGLTAILFQQKLNLPTQDALDLAKQIHNGKKINHFFPIQLDGKFLKTNDEVLQWIQKMKATAFIRENKTLLNALKSPRKNHSQNLKTSR